MLLPILPPKTPRPAEPTKPKHDTNTQALLSALFDTLAWVGILIVAIYIIVMFVTVASSAEPHTQPVTSPQTRHTEPVSVHTTDSHDWTTTYWVMPTDYSVRYCTTYREYSHPTDGGGFLMLRADVLGELDAHNPAHRPIVTVVTGNDDWDLDTTKPMRLHVQFDLGAHLGVAGDHRSTMRYKAFQVRTTPSSTTSIRLVLDPDNPTYAQFLMAWRIAERVEITGPTFKGVVYPLPFGEVAQTELHKCITRAQEAVTSSAPRAQEPSHVDYPQRR